MKFHTYIKSTSILKVRDLLMKFHTKLEQNVPLKFCLLHLIISSQIQFNFHIKEREVPSNGTDYKLCLSSCESCDKVNVTETTLSKMKLCNTNYVSIPRILLLKTCCLFVFYILSCTKSLCFHNFCGVWHLSNPKVNRPKSSLF